MCDSSSALILDIRSPSLPALELNKGHTQSINSIAWAPNSANHICTVGEDSLALMWDISSKPVSHPILQYNGGSQINQVQWGSQHPEFIAVSIDNSVQVVTI